MCDESECKFLVEILNTSNSFLIAGEKTIVALKYMRNLEKMIKK
ncbi:hypothetical protein rpr22_0924 [Rickettsia prowazekii str. Rp22]|uniref:Uncharacterized protein n=1 Tax=Rickettsia prowazekii (strain Rp22) TaxID=449216 RepID=D5AYE5_RICPP|nr:hypothetical protein rpr22_0924 [Rickettsia prowazekii str. Rp22]AGJ01472.1 tRNA pseudouridine synthase A [Rickettsia prowazekii str. NMRC Madrid E]AGJ02884.1 hypothetical protein H375_6590 [Rickettsia prowazekii str. Breinl]EOB09431.1 hypothetical protein H377_7350 [Rickettsia prowazekii str. Cairo 3]EOB10209.1 hypothetical protein H376_3570 [Rickettsia prowazekii str. GvF12]